MRPIAPDYRADAADPIAVLYCIRDMDRCSRSSAIFLLGDGRGENFHGCLSSLWKNAVGFTLRCRYILRGLEDFSAGGR